MIENPQPNPIFQFRGHCLKQLWVMMTLFPQTTVMIMMIFSIAKLTLNLKANMCFQVTMTVYIFPLWHLLMWHLNGPRMLANQLNGNIQQRQLAFSRKPYDWTQQLILNTASLNILRQRVFHNLFITKDIWENTVFQSNLYNNWGSVNSGSRKVKQVSSEEIKLVIGVILFMGIVKLPTHPMYCQEARCLIDFRINNWK